MKEYFFADCPEAPHGTLVLGWLFGIAKQFQHEIPCWVIALTRLNNAYCVKPDAPSVAAAIWRHSNGVGSVFVHNMDIESNIWKKDYRSLLGKSRLFFESFSGPCLLRFHAATYAGDRAIVSEGIEEFSRQRSTNPAGEDVGF